MNEIRPLLFPIMATYTGIHHPRFSLPRLLSIPPSLLHIHKVLFRIPSVHLTLILKALDQRFTYGLWHFSRGATNIYYAILVIESREDESGLLPDQVLHIDFFPLWGLVNGDADVKVKLGGAKGAKEIKEDKDVLDHVKRR